MRNRKVAVSGLVVAAVAFVGACADVPPTEPTIDPGTFDVSKIDFTPIFGSPTASSASVERGLDAAFARLAREIPGFGGMFYDEAGNLNVYMTGPQRREFATDAVLEGRLSSRLQAAGFDVTAGRGILIREGRYDFAQLHEWHQRLLPLFHLVPGVIFTDADERANRLRIGVEEGVSAAAVEQAISSLGIPTEAVILETAEPVMIPEGVVPMSNHTLRDRVRPVAAGLQIAFERPGEGFFACTMGFTIRAAGVRPPRGVQNTGFLTGSSACTPQIAVVDFAEYWQPSPSVANRFIGWEAFDPDFHRAGGHCAATWDRCRWSNVAGVAFAAGVSVDFGHVYRTLFPGTLMEGVAQPGSLEIDPANPRFRIVEEALFPVDGQTMHKVGRGAGWTTGAVQATCLNISVSGLPLPGLTVMVCQDRFTSLFAAGDQGAPVFQRLGTGADDRVRAHGIAWGFQTIEGIPRTLFSALSNIRLEFPGPWTVF